MDEIFGSNNFVSQISFKTSPGDTTKYLPPCLDYIIWYAKNKTQLKFRKLYLTKAIGEAEGSSFDWVELSDGTSRPISKSDNLEQLKKIGVKFFRWADPRRKGSSQSAIFSVNFEGRVFRPGQGMTWKTTKEGIERLRNANRLGIKGNQLNYKRYIDDFPYTELLNVWTDTMNSFMQRKYVVETNPLVIQRCILMSTDPGDLILDPTCGSGTSAFVCEQWGRRWISCDTSRVSIALARQRLMTSYFNYYELQHPAEGVGSGLKYKKAPHITLRSLANNEQPPEEILYDQPLVDKSKVRISGPFTVEAVPSPIVKSIDELDKLPVQQVDKALSRQGETVRQDEWREELLKTGIRGKAGQNVEFSRVEPLPATKWLHADAETKAKDRKHAVISFGPSHAPLEPRQVELAIKEAESLVPKPKMVVFAAFQFDPEAAKDIDELNWPGIDILKVQMNPDLLTEDLKKQKLSNQSFWLVGRPDVELRKEKDKYIVELKGFDYYNTITGQIESGDTKKIAMWFLDTDYDGRSLYPRQVFFPLSGNDEGIKKLARNLKAYVDEELMEKYTGTVSLPFTPGNEIEIKIVDDRGIESLRVLKVK